MRSFRPEVDSPDGDSPEMKDVSPEIIQGFAYRNTTTTRNEIHQMSNTHFFIDYYIIFSIFTLFLISKRTLTLYLQLTIKQSYYLHRILNLCSQLATK